jgi:carbon monoxide dehydrogenase subunit G
MDLAGEVAIPAPRERVWQALNDPAVLRACIPGCEDLVEESPTVRRARVLVKVGPVRARFEGRMTLSEVEAPQRCVLGFEGSGGAAGIASGRSQVELHEEGAATRLTYAVKAAVGGKLGQIGGRMIDASARQLADQFFAALQRELTPAIAVPPPDAVPEEDVMAGSTRNPAPPANEARDWTPGQARDDIRTARELRPAATTSEVSRVLWFLLGVASTGFGVWLGKVLLG